MTTPQTSANAFLARLGGVSALVIPVAMLLGVGSLAMVSAVTVPRSDPRAYLADLSANQAWIDLAPWFIGLIPLLSLFMWLGFHSVFHDSSVPGTRIAVLFGVVAAAAELAVAGLAGVLVGYIAPAWAAAEVELRPVIEADYLLVQWAFDVCLAAFDVFLAIAQVAASAVMLAQRRRLWTIVGWFGMTSGILNAVGAFWLLFEPLLPIGVLGFFAGIPWLVGFGTGLLRSAPSEHAA